MTLRALAVSAALCGCVALALGWLLLDASSVPRLIILQPSLDGGRPCLVSAEDCLELSDTPFAPCLVAVRCIQEWSVEPPRLSRDGLALRE
jgi:hypothetical protein